MWHLLAVASVIGIFLELVSQSFQIKDGDSLAGQIGLLWKYICSFYVRGEKKSAFQLFFSSYGAISVYKGVNGDDTKEESHITSVAWIEVF